MKNIKLLVTMLFLFGFIANANNQKGISSLSKINELGGVDLINQNIEIISGNLTEYNHAVISNFINNNGNWYFSLNKFTNLPVRAFGKPIQIIGYNLITKENIQQASIEFIKNNLLMFGINIDNLKLRNISKKDNTWYISFYQITENIEVLNTDITIRISDDGKVFSFGLNYFPIIELNKQENPKNNIFEIAKIGLDEYKINKPNIQSLYENKILPVLNTNGYSFLKVAKIPLFSEDELFSFESFVDLNSGQLIYRTTNFRDANTTVTNKGTIKFRSPVDKDTLVYFNEMKNYFDGDSVLTNYQGKIIKDINKSTNLISKFTGPWVHVTKLNSSYQFDISTANYTKTILPGENLVINWNDTISMKGERTLFWHANYIHSFYKNLDPEFYGMDSVLNLQIAFAGSPNALSGGKIIRFIGCQNPAYKFYESAAVLYHEWGHSVNYFHYQNHGSQSGMINAACNEAMADITSCMMLDDNLVGRGTKPSDMSFSIRNLKNNIIYPDSLTNESHHDGQILAGAFWDLREMTNADYVMKLSHKAKYGMPDDMNIGIAFSEWFLETLIADDDDNDLTNGTPYYDKIVEAFNNHRIGTNLFTKMSFKHEKYKDTQDTLTPYVISFELEYLPLPNGKPLPVKLYYTLGSLEKIYEVNAVENTKGKYTGEIPAQKAGTIVKYYFSAFDKLSSQTIFLSNSQSSNIIKPYIFTIGYQDIFSDDFDNDQNWKVGDLNDNATYGKWEFAFPNQITLSSIGTIQPGKGTSGNNCLVTGALGTAQNYYNYYPNGKTTVISKSFDLSKYNSPLIKFNKWFYNYYYYTTIPLFEFYISEDDGNSWILIDQSKSSTVGWENQLYSISDYTKKLDKIKFKFVVNIAKSNYITWVTEALIDEFKIVTPLQSITSVIEVNENEWLEISPNPSNGVIKLLYIKKYLGNGGPIDITLYSYSANNLINEINAFDLNGNKIIHLTKAPDDGVIKIDYKGVIIFEITTSDNKYFKRKIVNY